jgi:hypothetical protein
MKNHITLLSSLLVIQTWAGLSLRFHTCRPFRDKYYYHSSNNAFCTRRNPTPQPEFSPKHTLSSSSSSLKACLLSDDSHLFTSYTTLLTSAVPIFDGSTIRDPVVNSSLYWSNLWHGITAWLLTQLIVGIVASIALVFSTSQVIALGEYFSRQTNRWLSTENKSRNIDNDLSSSIIKPWTINTTIYQRPDRVVKLALCIVIDLLGSLSEVIPVLGEVLDLLWAPIAAYTLRSLYAGSNVIFIIEFMEEILPFSDLIPFATICWIIETYFDDSELAKALQIGSFERK